MKKKKRKKVAAAGVLVDEVQAFDEETQRRYESLLAEILPLEAFAKTVHIELPPPVARPLRAGSPYLRRVEGGVVKTIAPVDGLLVRGHDGGEVFVSLREVLAAVEELGR